MAELRKRQPPRERPAAAQIGNPMKDVADRLAVRLCRDGRRFECREKGEGVIRDDNLLLVIVPGTPA